MPIEERYVYTYCTDDSDADANYTNRKQESEFEHFICRPFVKVAEEDDIHNKNYEAKGKRNFAAQRDSIASKFFIALVHKPIFFHCLGSHLKSHHYRVHFLPLSWLNPGGSLPAEDPGW